MCFVPTVRTIRIVRALRTMRIMGPPRLIIFLALFGTLGKATSQTRLPDLVATYARVDTFDLKIDLHLPPPRYEKSGQDSTMVSGEAQRPVLLWIHGGGWRGGSRSEECPALPLLDSGYVVASIDYRLSQQAPWPAQLYDAKAAVRWLRAHAEVLRLDTARVVAWGTSAGAHVAAMLGVTSPGDSLEGRVGADTGTTSRVRAVVDYYGPTNFLEFVPRLDAVVVRRATPRLWGGEVFGARAPRQPRDLRVTR